jgi:hypothetical protein
MLVENIACFFNLIAYLAKVIAFSFILLQSFDALSGI